MDLPVTGPHDRSAITSRITQCVGCRLTVGYDRHINLREIVVEPILKNKKKKMANFPFGDNSKF